MKRNALFLLLLLLAASGLFAQQATNLFFSEYIEGSSNNKAIEIFNGTGAAVDLSNYTVKLAPNGGAYTNTLTLSGTLANNDVYVIANASAAAAILAVSDITSTVTYFNGDDALGLFQGTTLIDVIGVQGVDPGVGWDVAGTTEATLNHTLVRKPTVISPTTDWAASAGTNATDSQWLVYPQDTFTYLGSHTMGGGNIPPQIAGVTLNPIYPEATTTVSVSASITDPGRSISTASLAWGLSSTALTQTITMNLSTGSTYVTATPIPVQTAGTVVYYKISATDNGDGSSDTGVLSYTVLTIPTLTIAQIQGTGDTSPYADQGIRTTGVITATHSNGFFIQDAAGARNGVYVYDPGHSMVQGNSITIVCKAAEYSGNTELKDIGSLTVNGTGTIPAPTVITTGALGEDYEGVLVRVVDATCTAINSTAGEWTVDDGSGAAVVDDLIYAYTPTLSTNYQVTGPVYYATNHRIVPRSAADIVMGGGDVTPPTVTSISTPTLTRITVVFSEAVELSSAEDVTNYSVTPGITISSATRDATLTNRVYLTVSTMTAGTAYVLHVDAVEDLAGNTLDEGAFNFTCALPAVPHLVINEIMYNSPESNDNEWVELYNAGTSSVDLNGFSLVDNDPTHTHITIGSGYSVAPGDYFTIRVHNGDSFPFTPDFDGASQVTWALNNTTDEVNLFDSNSTKIDSVGYGSTAPWPTAPNGSGPSLELLNPTFDNSLPASWAASLANGGTPGEANSVYSTDTGVRFATSEATVNEDDETYTLHVSIINPSATVATHVDVALTTGDPADVGNYTTTTLTFPAGSSADQTLVIQITDDTIVEPIDSLTFTLQNVSGGSSAQISSPSAFCLVIVDNDTPIPPIVINEINYNPPEAGTDVNEFIELYNNGNTTVDLSGCYFSAGVVFTFPEGVSMAPYSYLVVAVSATDFTTTYGFAPDYQWTSGGLSNSGETIALSNAGGAVIDEVTYGCTDPWPTAPAGNGPTLELIDPNSDNSLATSWAASTVNGGTPKADNSVAVLSSPVWVTIGTTGGQPSISWAPVVGATGYNIYRGTFLSGISLYTTVGAGVTTFTDTTPVSGTKCFYYVTATR